MDLTQTKFIALTMELDLKAREYKILCDKFDELNKKDIDPNDERLLQIKELFEKNCSEIEEINRQIRELSNL